MGLTKVYLPIETLLVCGQPYDPFNQEPFMLRILEIALQEVK